MAGTFNVDQFLSTEVKGSNDTSTTPIPEGVYRAQVFKLSARKVTQEGEEPRVVMDVLWEVLDDDLKKKLNIEKPIAKQGLFLDMLPNGAIDMSKNKNVPLGQLREALGQNRADRPWMPSMLKGQVAMIQVSQRPDKDNANIIYNDVKKVTSLRAHDAAKAGKAA